MKTTQVTTRILHSSSLLAASLIVASSGHAATLYWDPNTSGSLWGTAADVGTWGTSDFWTTDSSGGFSDLGINPATTLPWVTSSADVARLNQGGITGFTMSVSGDVHASGIYYAPGNSGQTGILNNDLDSTGVIHLYANGSSTPVYNNGNEGSFTVNVPMVLEQGEGGSAYFGIPTAGGGRAGFLTLNGNITSTNNVNVFFARSQNMNMVGNLNIKGTVTSAQPYSNQARAVTISGSIGSDVTAVVMSGVPSTTMILSGTNSSYTGTITANSGTLLATKVDALAGYDVPGKVVFTGGTLAVPVGVGATDWTTTQVDTLLSNATKTSGALGIDTTTAAVGGLTQWTAFTTTNFGSTLGLTKRGTNILTLDQANTYTGVTTVDGGTLRANDGTGLPTASALFITNGVFETSANLVRNPGPGMGQMALDSKVQLNPVGFSARGGPVKVCFGSLASPTALTWVNASDAGYNGPFNMGNNNTPLILNAATADNTLEFLNPVSLVNAARFVQVDANVVTMSGNITSTGVNGGLTKTGPGTLVLGGADNTYSGPTQITAGVLRATQATGLPNTSYLKLNGGVYETSGAFTRVNSTTVNGANFNWSANNGGFSANGGKLTVTINNDAATEQIWVTANTNNGIRGILKFGSSTANAETEFQNNLDLTGGGRAMDVAAGTGGDFATISGVIRDSAGTGSLTKIGAGRLVLNNTNTYVGSTIISAGTLALGEAGSIASSSSINLAAAAVLDTTAQASFAIPAAQPVTLHLSGTGTGSCARIMAGALDITNANVILTVDSTLDDPIYVLADYTTLVGSVFLSVTDPLPDGYTLNYTHNGGTQIALVSSGVSGYSMWATANAGDEAANLDYDKDGVANGVEYFMGETGSTFTANPTVAGGKVTWPYDATTSGITYQVMSSTDLSSWVPVSPQPVPSGGTLEYTLPTGTPKLFVRLEVVTTP